MRNVIFVLTLLVSFPALAQQQPTQKKGPPPQTFDGELRDSIYYTLDDGVMTKEEMEEEARYIYDNCQKNPFQSAYMNCECISGAFLIRREKEGPMTSQASILENISLSGQVQCANTEAIAGKTYEECMMESKYFRETATDNEEYCTCVANQVANEFSKKPIGNPSYVSELASNAKYDCEPGRKARTPR
jgi:hypothetical protein